MRIQISEADRKMIDQRDHAVIERKKQENALLTEKVTALELSSKQLERELQNANNCRTEKEIEM